MSGRRRYLAHGLVVDSDIDLALSPAESAGAAESSDGADLTLRLGAPRPVPDLPAPGRPLAELYRDGARLYSFAQDGDRTVLRYPGLCELVGDRSLTEVTAHLHPGADPGLLGVLGGGNLLAVNLLLGGRLVLHAAAVRHGEGPAVAFVGSSGRGKSTLAAACCVGGADLVTDDVMRVDAGPGGSVLVYPGATEHRLRADSGALAAASDPATVRTTADGRLALRSRRRAPGPLPLAACVVPTVCRDADAVSVRRLPPAAALCVLLAFPKVAGWCDRDSLGRGFQATGDLVERVPVYAATIPWGVPPPSGVLAELFAGIGVPLAVSGAQR